MIFHAPQAQTTHKEDSTVFGPTLSCGTTYDGRLIEIRPPSTRDLSLAHLFVKDDSLDPYFMNNGPRPDQATFARALWGEATDPTQYTWWIYCQSQFAGFAGIWKFDQCDFVQVSSAYLHYAITPTFRGQGVAFQASRAILYYAFSDLCREAMVVEIRQDNVPSKRLAIKLGFHAIWPKRHQLSNEQRVVDLWYGRLNAPKHRYALREGDADGWSRATHHRLAQSTSQRSCSNRERASASFPAGDLPHLSQWHTSSHFNG